VAREIPLTGKGVVAWEILLTGKGVVAREIPLTGKGMVAWEIPLTGKGMVTLEISLTGKGVIAWEISLTGKGVITWEISLTGKRGDSLGDIIKFRFLNRYLLLCRVMVFNSTFNNISVISQQSVLLVEETVVPGAKYCRSLTNLSHYVVLSTPRVSGIRTHNVSGDRH
jgi:hypothetical protein